MAQQAQPLSSSKYDPVQRSAWLTLLLFFALFCIMIALGGYFGWRYYTTAMIPVEDTLWLRYAPTGVLLKEPNLAAPQDIPLPEERPDGCQNDVPRYCVNFFEGQRLVGQRDAGYGPVSALILADQSRVNLHTQPDGFVFGLKKYQVSRWTQELQDVVFEQLAGYARYDLATNQPYKRTNFSVAIGENAQATVILAAGGSYSIDMPRTGNGEPRGRLVNDAPLLMEISVRSGSAVLESKGASLNLRPGDKVQIALDGSFVTVDNNPYQAAQWELIPDGEFSDFTTAQYNTADQTNTWSIGSNGDPTKPGEFSVVRTCAPEKGFCKNADDQMNYGQFLRDASDGQQFITGINNTIDVDISEFTESLEFSAWVTVIKESSVPLTGVRGSECPIVVVIDYKQRSPTDATETFRRCYFTGEGDYVQDSNFTYERISPGPIQRVKFDLRQLGASLRTAWYIDRIRIEARGQDYFSRVTNVSLVGQMKQ